MLFYASKPLKIILIYLLMAVIITDDDLIERTRRFTYAIGGQHFNAKTERAIT